ncbi:flippase-like domain-containing protein [Pontibacter sp. JH31]|uniref:Flippase-like domain-containing protein n=1 Tax=Pontibacter aquaedesilientis TaxID=2766980 RepID=A0ABR7XF49_9BACT|nr:lysylphosphatidylglycerol synthase transmembrane domain-containing protein [Pontibacter aquaedesilientis]MBD1396923.1 flippase-like domain-containing protein [Pontibacter aquaedesilientis]
MDKKQVWDVLKTPLKLVVTGSLLYFVSQKIELEEVKGVYRQSEPLYLLLAVFTFFCSQIVSSFRLLGFFRAKGIDLTFKYNLKLYLLGMFYNLFLPGGIGGDGYKIYLLSSKFNFSTRTLLAAIFLDRLSGLWALSCLAALFLIFIPEIARSPILILTTLGTGTLMYLFVSIRLSGIALSTALAAHLKALLVQALQVATVMLILMALNFEGNYLPYLLTFLVSSLVAIFPLSVGGLGAREYVFVLAASLLQMDKNLAVTLSLTFYLVSAVVALGGVYFVFSSKEFSLIPGKKKPETEKEELAPVRNT